MQAKKRYILLCTGGLIVVLLVYLLGIYPASSSASSSHQTSPHDPSSFWKSGPAGVNTALHDAHLRVVKRSLPAATRSYLDADDIASDINLDASAKRTRRVHRPSSSGQTTTSTDGYKNCRMETCFDLTKCSRGFKVYVYPIRQPISDSYMKVLNALRESRYYTSDPTDACVFVPSLDTIDRDVLSDDFVKHLDAKLQNLEFWNDGRNHVLFNMFSGTWPDYRDDDLGINPRAAILAQASVSMQKFRAGFDIAAPLFSKEHAQKGGERGALRANNIPSTRKYLLAFKGKRYLSGIGSETRNALYHIHNGKDIVLLTTCKHGKGWKTLMDERCPHDNALYDKYDYKDLLFDSTFCLVPRGRRLGSFRFLEVLQAGCIPVILSNDWELPFSEVIDWNKVVVWGDERLLLQVPSIVRSISHQDVLALRQQTQVLWDAYFSSVDKIVASTLEILRNRVEDALHKSSLVWNTIPGALLYMNEFSSSLSMFPFYYGNLGFSPVGTFTAVIYSTGGSSYHPQSSLYKLVKQLGRSAFLEKLLIIWQSSTTLPSRIRWPVPRNVTIVVINNAEKTISSRFFPYSSIKTNAVLSLDDDAMLTTDEIDFAFSIWRQFPDRIVGYPARNHFWDDERSRWGYSSKWTNDYSMVLTGAAFYHGYYNYLFTNYLATSLLRMIDQWRNCEDILMNFLVSHVTKLPPIKVTQRKQYKESMSSSSSSGHSTWLSAEHFATRQHCINIFASTFGYMPLIRSSMRLDPILFKDPVSVVRKKYRQIETVT
ncbi:exostosin-1a-like [Tubulanus polymorphus]|uniref:exostosin-1a-like n=1 Tax=Tubulanus polymorphus TaxID=672921 RepID=UPI003DA2DB1A